MDRFFNPPPPTWIPQALNPPPPRLAGFPWQKTIFFPVKVKCLMYNSFSCCCVVHVHIFCKLFLRVITKTVFLTADIGKV